MAKRKEPLPDLVDPATLAKLADVPRQMIFNYLRSGRIVGIRSKDHEGRWMISREEAVRWLKAREEKAQTKYDKIQRQLRGEE